MAPPDQDHRADARRRRKTRIGVVIGVILGAIVLYFWFAEGTGTVEDTGATPPAADRATDPGGAPDAATDPAVE